MSRLLSSVYLAFYKKCKNRRYKDLKNRENRHINRAFLGELYLYIEHEVKKWQNKSKEGRRQRQDVR